jgi:hypothetical protein
VSLTSVSILFSNIGLSLSTVSHVQGFQLN